MEKKRQIIYFKNYYWNFFNSQTEKVKDKIDYVLFLITVADRIPKKFLINCQVMMDYLKYGLNLRVISSGFFVVSTREV